MLEIVEAESIANCAVIMIGNDGSVTTGWANNNKPFVMLGGMTYLMQESGNSTIE